MKTLIKKLLKEALLNENKDCRNLFTDSSDGSLHITAIKNDLYYYVIKLKTVTLEFMSPNDFFDEIGGFERHQQLIDWDDVKKKVQQMKNGEKLNIPYLIYSYGWNSGHEGRHRALAAKEMGCNSMPVMVEKGIGKDVIMKLANEVGDLDIEDMKKVFIERGFKHFQNIDMVASTLRKSKKNGYYSTY